MQDRESGVWLNWNYVIISIVVVTALALTLMYVPDAVPFDKELLKTIQDFLSPYPSYIPLFFSEFGYANWMTWPQITVVAVLTSHQRYLKAFLFLIAMQAAFRLPHLIKDFICRERPCGDAYPGFSFPSVHSTAIMTLMGILIYLSLKYIRNTFARYLTVSIMGIYIVMVGVSRMWLNHHYPIDVCAGMFLGFVIVNLYIILDKTFTRL